MKRVCGCQNSALSFCIRVCVCSANHQVSRFFINDPEELTATVTIARASKMASYQWVIVIKLELLLDELALVLRV